METHVDPSLMASAFATLAHDWRPVLPRRALPAGEGRWTCTRCGATYEGPAHSLPRGLCAGRGL